MIKWHEDWAEAFSLFFLVLGFLIAIILSSVFLIYLVIIFSGILAGRTLYVKKKRQPILPFVMMITAFLVGYLVGGFRVNNLFLVVFFLLSFILSYYLHKKKIFTTFKSTKYIK